MLNDFNEEKRSIYFDSVTLDPLFLQPSENSVRGAAGVTVVTIVFGEEQLAGCDQCQYNGDPGVTTTASTCSAY